MKRQDTANLIKKVSTSQLIVKTLLLSRKREGLAGEPSTKNIMRRYILLMYLCDVPINGNIREIFPIKFLQLGLNLRRKDTVVPQTGKGEMKAP